MMNVSLARERVRIHVIVEPYSFYAFAVAHQHREWRGVKGLGNGLFLIKNEALPFYDKHGVRIRKVHTKRHSEYLYSTDVYSTNAQTWKREKLGPHPYSAFLANRRVEHIVPRRQGYLEREKVAPDPVSQYFKRMLTQEFLGPLLEREPDVDLQTLQTKLRDFLKFYNEERPIFGFPNSGQPPLACFLANAPESL